MKFAEERGINYTTLRKALSGTRPRIDTFVSIAAAADVTVEWLATGRGPMRPGAQQAQSQTPAPFGSSDLVPVQRVGASASAGPGLVPVDHEAAEIMGFSEHWLRSLGLRPNATAAIIVEGDSMTRPDGSGIPDGALALVDTAITADDVKTGCVYVIVRGDELVVKRIEHQLDGTITLHSDNPRYTPERVPPDVMERLHIAGRVRWIGFRV